MFINPLTKKGQQTQVNIASSLFNTSASLLSTSTTLSSNYLPLMEGLTQENATSNKAVSEQLSEVFDWIGAISCEIDK